MKDDREGPQATASYSRNWLIVFGALLLIAILGFVSEFVFGASAAAAATTLALAIVGMFALIDGGWRLFGNEGFLGPGEGIDRALAAIQVILATLGLLRIITG